MPLLPASLTEPVWVQFCALLDDQDRPEFSPSHPWGCHRRRIPDRVVFDHVLAALVHGSGYERISSPGCSDRTIRRRVAEWSEAGIAQQLHRLALEAFDQMIAPGPGRHLRGRLDHQVTVRRGGLRAQSGRPRQAGHETIRRL